MILQSHIIPYMKYEKLHHFQKNSEDSYNIKKYLYQMYSNKTVKKYYILTPRRLHST